MDLSKPFDTINHELLIGKYGPTVSPKMPWNWFSVICQNVGKEARLVNRTLLQRVPQ